MGSLVPAGDGPPKGDVCQVAATWSNQVMFTPDPTHNGNPTPGIVGRLYLFGPTVGLPLGGDGSLVVDLYDEGQGPITPETLPLEEWHIDKDTLQRLQRRDFMGWGYTVFLPWGTYKPEISKIRLRVRYQPTNATPLYAESRVTLDNGENRASMEMLARSSKRPVKTEPVELTAQRTVGGRQ